MLRNLPLHFENPDFRADALRGVGNANKRIEEMITKLSALRQKPEHKPEATDVNLVVAEALDRVGNLEGVEVTQDLQPVPQVLADHEQIRSVITNLLLNARDAIGSHGHVRIHTVFQGGRVVVSVSDNGCGMSPTFIRESLFRPFHSTKKHGLGVGMFQARMIVEAHGGAIRVQSEPGRGSEIQIWLPAKGLP